MAWQGIRVLFDETSTLWARKRKDPPETLSLPQQGLYLWQDLFESGKTAFAINLRLDNVYIVEAAQGAIQTFPCPSLTLHSIAGTNSVRSTSSVPAALEADGSSECASPYPSPPMSKSPTPPRRITSPTASSTAANLPEPGLVPAATIPLYLQEQTQAGAQQQHEQPQPQSVQASAGTQEGDRRSIAPSRQIQSTTPAIYATPLHAPRFDDAPYAQPTQYGSGPSGPSALLPNPRPIPPTRRTKTHVQSACFNCKKAHLSCDVNRPCNRCVSSGKQDTCVDVEHKKRGRPRLRDERGNKVTSSVSRVAPRSPQPAAQVSASPSHPQLEPRRAPEQLRVLRSQDVEQATQQGHYYSPRQQQQTQVGYSQPMYSYPGNLDTRYEVQPIAFLDMDLKIARTNNAFRNILGQGMELHGRHLDILVDSNDRLTLQDVRRLLRDERDAAEPQYVSAPITMTEIDGIPPVEAVDLQGISQSFIERPASLKFRFPNSQVANLVVTLRLAKADVYFVQLSLPPVADTTTYQNPQYGQSRAGYQAYGMLSPYSYGASFIPHQQYTYGAAGQNLPTVRGPTSSAPESPFYNFQNIASSLPATGPSILTQTRTTYDTSFFYPTNYQGPPIAPYGYGQSSPVTAGVAQSEYRQLPPYSTNQYPQHHQGAMLNDPTSSGLQLPPISSDSLHTRQQVRAMDPPGQPQARGVVRRRETDSPSEEEDTGRKRQRLNLRQVLD